MNIGLKTVFRFKKFNFSFVLFLFLIPGVSAGAIYKWVDENGKTHYGSERPKTSQAKKLNIKTKEPVTHRKTKDEKKDGKKEDDKNKAIPTALEEPKMSTKEKFRLCNQAKTDMQRIEARGRIRQKDKDGNVRYLSPKERGDRIRAAKKDVKDFCR